MTTFNLIITVLTSVITLISLSLGTVKDIHDIRKFFKTEEEAGEEIATNHAGETVTKSGLIIPKGSYNPPREHIYYEV